MSNSRWSAIRSIITGELLTTDAGDQRETESFARPEKRALCGYLVGCVRSLSGNGVSIIVTVTGDGLKSGKITIGPNP